MKKITFLFFLGLLCITGFSASAQNKLTVAIAANVQFVMEQLKIEFENEDHGKVELITGSSGKLAAQIREGAPFDIFVSADMAYPQQLFKDGFAANEPKPYATGQLVVWTASPAIYPSADLKALLSDTIKKIAIANRKTAPYGKAAEEALKYYGIYDKVKDKLVYGESIGQAQQFIATGAAEIGFIAKSQVLSGGLNSKGHWVDIDKRAYSPIIQGVVILKHGKETNDKLSQKFYQFLFSPKAKAIFIKYGYRIN